MFPSNTVSTYSPHGVTRQETDNILTDGRTTTLAGTSVWPRVTIAFCPRCILAYLRDYANASARLHATQTRFSLLMFV